MRTIVPFIFSFLVLKPSTFGQYIPTVVEGKEWTIRFDYGLGSYSYFQYFLACDTVINDKTYLSIHNEQLGILGFVREDTSEQEIFYLPLNSDSETEIVSYKHEIGDTVIVSGAEVVILDIHYYNLWGMLRKIFVVPWPYRFIEGAGMMLYGVYPFPLGWPWPTLFDIQQTSLACEDISTSLSMPESPSISVYPNPFTTRINIINQTNSLVPYEVFDLSGKSIHSGYTDHHTSINTDFWSSGIYILVSNGSAIKMLKSK